MGHVERKKIELGDDGSDPSSSSSSHLCLCRICHEEEEMEANTMEAPCDCSGTLKFAHRGCIQRWCDEKGNTICEICLQKFKPDYTLPPNASQLIDVMVTIRGSLEVPRLNYEPQWASGGTESDSDDMESFCRPVPLAVATMLLVWQLVTVITGDDDYPFALTTVLMVRAGGILLPFYLVMRVISAIQCSHWQQQGQHLRIQQSLEAMSPSEEDLDTQQHVVEIQS